MNISPVIFTEGNDFFKELSKNYVTHSKGLFILAPSGSGKTYFCTNQPEQHWIDGDELWLGSHAHPKGAWWLEPKETMDRIDKRSDVVTMEAMNEGLWIMGASNCWLRPDAIVIPEWETHKDYIATRHRENYDGGATPNDHDQVLDHIEFIKKWHTEHNVPMFSTIDDAVRALTSSAN